MCKKKIREVFTYETISSSNANSIYNNIIHYYILLIIHSIALGSNIIHFFITMKKN